MSPRQSASMTFVIKLGCSHFANTFSCLIHVRTSQLYRTERITRLHRQTISRRSDETRRFPSSADTRLRSEKHRHKQHDQATSSSLLSTVKTLSSVPSTIQTRKTFLLSAYTAIDRTLMNGTRTISNIIANVSIGRSVSSDFLFPQ